MFRAWSLAAWSSLSFHTNGRRPRSRRSAFTSDRMRDSIPAYGPAVAALWIGGAGAGAAGGTGAGNAHPASAARENRKKRVDRIGFIWTIDANVPPFLTLRIFPGAASELAQNREDPGWVDHFRPGGENPEPARALVKLLGKGREVDRPDPSLPGQPLDFVIPAQHRDVQPEHLGFERIIEQQLPRSKLELPRQRVLRICYALAVG